MIKTTDIVKSILVSSEVALTALSAGFLNLSAYAQLIHAEVERQARKPVRPGTIVVALSRLARTLDEQKPLLPEVALESIAVKSGLVEITFDKSKDSRSKLQMLYQDKSFLAADFATITHGVHELSIIVPAALKRTVLAFYKGQKPRLVLDNLASLTVRYGENYLYVPNTNYALLRQLALRRINVVEIVSTFTELSFIVDQNDLNDTFVTMNAWIKSRTQRAVGK